MRDSLPAKPWKNEACIVNLDDHDGPGTHWVCFRKVSDDVTYFDSYGNLQPPLEIQDYMQGYYISYNITAYQSIKVDSVMCGHLCLAFLL